MNNNPDKEILRVFERVMIMLEGMNPAPEPRTVAFALAHVIGQVLADDKSLITANIHLAGDWLGRIAAEEALVEREKEGEILGSVH
jgi:hypothetical protein